MKRKQLLRRIKARWKRWRKEEALEPYTDPKSAFIALGVIFILIGFCIRWLYGKK